MKIPLRCIMRKLKTIKGSKKHLGPPGRPEHHKTTFGLTVELSAVRDTRQWINILKVLRKNNYLKFYTQLKYHSRE